MIALTSLLLGATATFSGGSVDDLAKSLADETGKNAIIVTAVVMPKIDKFTYDTSSSDSLSSSIFTGAKLRMAPGGDPVFSDRCYTAEHFREIIPQAPGAPPVAKSVPDGTLTNGKVTLETAGASPLAISTLAALKWSKAMRVDPLLADLAVSASVKDMPERTFLNELASAAGAFLTVDDNGFHLAYDGEQLRVHVQNTLKLQQPGTPRQLLDAKRDFYSAVIALLPLDTLDPIFTNIGLEPKLDVLPNSDLAHISVAYIKEVEEVPSRPYGGTPEGAAPQNLRGRGSKQDILSRVDDRAMVHLRLNGSGEIVLSVPVFQGKQSTYIEI